MIIIGPSSHPRLVARAAKTSSAQLSRQNPGGQRCYGIEPPGFLMTRMALVQPGRTGEPLTSSSCDKTTRLVGQVDSAQFSSSSPSDPELSGMDFDEKTI